MARRIPPPVLCVTGVCLFVLALFLVCTPFQIRVDGRSEDCGPPAAYLVPNEPPAGGRDNPEYRVWGACRGGSSSRGLPGLLLGGAGLAIGIVGVTLVATSGGTRRP